jgi:fructose-1,6-bisphosphatase
MLVSARSARRDALYSEMSLHSTSPLLILTEVVELMASAIEILKSMQNWVSLLICALVRLRKYCQKRKVGNKLRKAPRITGRWGIAYRSGAD